MKILLIYYISGGIQMKYIVVAIISVLAVVCSSFSTSAASIKELPVTQTSGHWKVTLEKLRRIK